MKSNRAVCVLLAVLLCVPCAGCLRGTLKTGSITMGMDSIKPDLYHSKLTISGIEHEWSFDLEGILVELADSSNRVAVAWFNAGAGFVENIITRVGNSRDES